MQGMGYYGPGGGLFAAAGLGQQTTTVPATTTSTGTSISISQPIRTAMYVAGTASVFALAYHGYKRNNSVGWALVWGILGGAFWPLGVPIAVAQGFGKPVRAARNRRRKRSQ